MPRRRRCAAEAPRRASARLRTLVRVLAVAALVAVLASATAPTPSAASASASASGSASAARARGGAARGAVAKDVVSVRTAWGQDVKVPTRPLDVPAARAAASGSGALASLANHEVRQLVASTWDAVVAAHPDGLADAKLGPAAPFAPLSDEEAGYHFAAARAGVVDSARFLITFGVMPALAAGGGPVNTAVQLGDMARLRALLEDEGGDANERREDGSTPLHTASALVGRLEAAALLLTKGADVEARGANGATPLMLAAAVGHADAVRLLVRGGGADPNAQHSFAQTTALHFAAEQGHVDAIEALCQLGADPNRVNKVNGTPLHTACDSNRPEAVAALVRVCGADMTVLLNGDTTPLYLAAQRGFPRVVRMLLELGADMDFVMPRPHERESAKKRAGYVSTAVVPAADGRGHDVYGMSRKNTEPGNGATALHVAAENGHLDAVHELLKAGAVQKPSMEGASPLLIAIQYNHPNIAARLMNDAHGACSTVNARASRDGSFPLFAAAGAGWVSLVRAMIAKCGDVLDVNLRNVAGASALSHAAYRSRLEVVDDLLRAKAVVGLTELEAAVAGAHGLLRQGAREFRAEFGRAAAALPRGDAVRLLRAAAERAGRAGGEAVEAVLAAAAPALGPDGVDAVFDEDSGATPLLHAAVLGHAEAARALLDAGARVDARARRGGPLAGASPLYLAASAGHEAVVALLLERGAHPETGAWVGRGPGGEGGDGRGAEGGNVPPLRAAAERGHARVVQLLLANGASQDADTLAAVVVAGLDADRAKELAQMARGADDASVARALDVLSAELGERSRRVITEQAAAAAADPSKASAEVGEGGAARASRKLGVAGLLGALLAAEGSAASRRGSGALARGVQAGLVRVLSSTLLLQSTAQTRISHEEALAVVRLVARLAPDALWTTHGPDDGLDPLQAAALAYAGDEGDGEGGAGGGAQRAAELVRELMRSPAPRALRAARKSGYTALHIAAESSRGEVVAALVSGAAPAPWRAAVRAALRARTLRGGETPLDVARRVRDFDVLKVLSRAEEDAAEAAGGDDDDDGAARGEL